MATALPRLPPRAPLAPPPPPVRGRVYIDVERCKGCEFCIEFCPQGVVVFSRGMNAKGYHYPVVVKAECIQCSLCAAICPEYAIHAVRLPPGAPPQRVQSNPDEALQSKPKRTGSPR
jgi:2-oxoglutarate ferredoxin oxidoreductase subunit delta